MQHFVGYRSPNNQTAEQEWAASKTVGTDIFSISGRSPQENELVTILNINRILTGNLSNTNFYNNTTSVNKTLISAVQQFNGSRHLRMAM
jgi:hypothetical protein